MIDIKKRELLLDFLVAGAGLAVTPGFSSTENRNSLKILVLGGTGFIDPNIVRQALAGSHEVTIFNRERSNTGLFPKVKKLVGDRAPAGESIC